MLPAHPRGRQPGPALGRRWPTAPSTASSPTTRPSTADLKTGRLRHRLGRHLLASSSACPPSGPRPAGAATPWRTSSAGCPTRTAALAGLTRKGAIEAGRDADFAVLAPDETFTVDPAALQHRNRVTAYAGTTLHGVVKSTWLRGERIVGRRRVHRTEGRLLTRP